MLQFCRGEALSPGPANRPAGICWNGPIWPGSLIQAAVLSFTSESPAFLALICKLFLHPIWDHEKYLAAFLFHSEVKGNLLGLSKALHWGDTYFIPTILWAAGNPIGTPPCLMGHFSSAWWPPLLASVVPRTYWTQTGEWGGGGQGEFEGLQWTISFLASWVPKTLRRVSRWRL